MEPGLRDGDHLLIDRLACRRAPPARGDVVVLYGFDSADRAYIKRIIGLPGETVLLEQEGMTVDGHPLHEPYLDAMAVPPPYQGLEWELGADQFFVLGDNRRDSWDSRRFGPVARDQLVGVAWLRYWPPSRWALLTRGPETTSG